MKETKLIFHYISYLQYPLMMIAMLFALKSYIFGFETLFSDFNKMLVFMGLGISFSTLQDTTKTQNKLSLKIYQNPSYARNFIILIVLQILLLVTIGMFGLFAMEDSIIKELSLGLIVLGIGLIGMLKSVTEMAENH
jgi:4-amino-4-deoxy-L-arabinose transferase-like glycosyltransferase